MRSYYERALSGSRLRRCYELAPPRVRQYLAAEVDFVLQRLEGAHTVLELGCGYGRVLDQLAGHAQRIVGIDLSPDSLRLAHSALGPRPACALAAMNAAVLAFRDRSFDAVLCIQNGLAVFGVDPRDVVAEAVRITRSGGKILLSSYADGFWDARLTWFELQAEEGLVGAIDYSGTGDGVIVCRDGFRAATLRAADFVSLAADCGVEGTITEVDGSSVFCEIVVP